jgi:hypothetical protein
VSDSIDTDLANRMRATMHLMECAHDWERIARDESLMDGVRVFAAERARAIREELRPT